MRELRFRCFYRGELYDVKELSFSDGFIHVMIEMDLEGLGKRMVLCDSEHVKGLMQYTGLKDKNGKEIYEGDIVNDGNTIMEVKWFEKFSCFCLISDRWMFPHFFGEASDPDNCEVIGNIYEHSM